MNKKHQLKIIAFEGLDKSGKRTQSELLAQELSERGYNVVHSEFHRYDTPTGKLIRQFLDGEYKAPQLAIECIMAADKYAQLDWFKELEQQGIDVLILDRYTLSQLVYAKAQDVDADFVYGILELLPAPTFEFYLDISVEESIGRKGQHGENDLYERNHAFLQKVQAEYNRYFEINEDAGKTAVIEASRPKLDIHEEILKRTLQILE